MSDRAALFANVLEQPADDAARLVLADWLEENGEVGFGQFLRAGVVASRFRDEPLIEDPDYYAALASLANFAKAGQPATWVASLGVGPDPLTWHDWSWDGAGDRVTVRVGQSAGVFARGLLAELEVSLEEWYAVAPGALAAWPVERARITDVPGLSFQVERLEGGWRLTGRVKLSHRDVPMTGRLAPAVIAPGAVLTETAADWAAEEFFGDRAALVAEIVKESASLVDDLKAAAGDRWPRPRRRRL